MNTILERVDAGIEWANENIPDWPEYVNPSIIDIRKGDLCFLGQYWNGKYKVPVEDQECGFSQAFFSFFRDDWERVEILGFSLRYGTYEELTAAWRQKFGELGLLHDES